MTEFEIGQTSLQVTPNVRLLASSRGLGWTDLFAAVTDELPHDGLHGAVPAVWLVTAFSPNEIQRIGAGYRHEQTLPRNAISIVGSDDAVYDEIATPLKAVHIYLKQKIVDEVADELFKDGRGRREIRSSFGVDDVILRHLLSAVRFSLNETQPSNRLMMDYLAQAVATHLLAKYSVLGPALDKRQAPSLSSGEIGRIFDYIDTNLSHDISVAELAGIVGLGRAQFSARFKATTAMTVHQFVTTKRIQRARKFLADPHMDDSLVATICGFASRAHFIVSFKRAVGVTPREYRRRKA